MKKVNFTAERVSSFKCEADKKQSIYWDNKAPGLGLRITANGAKSYIFETRLHGKTARITIGDIRSWTIGKAQEQAFRFKVMTDQGIDPRFEKEKARLANEERLNTNKIQERKKTLLAREAWDIYINTAHPKWGAIHKQDHINLSQLGGEPHKRGKGITKAGPLASILNKPLAAINAEIVANWIDAEKSHRATATLNSFRKFRAFIRWCSESSEYRAYTNDGCCNTKKIKDALPSKRSKEGDCLQREQLKIWFSEVGKIGNRIQSAYLQTLLLTGARREELAGLKWSDIDFKWKSLTIRDKVEGERVIPLTPYVASLLYPLTRQLNNNWVFSSLNAASGRLQEPRIAHRKALVAGGLPHVSLHGLRRSFGTLVEWVECPAGIAAQIMGHKPSATAEKHYRRRPLDLLRKWHIKIEAWILEQAEITFDYEKEEIGIRLIEKS